MKRPIRALAFTALAIVVGCDDSADVDVPEEPESPTASQTTVPSMADAGTAMTVDAGTTSSGIGVRDAGAGVDAGGACASLSYESFGKAFLQKYCVGCHQGKAPPDGIDLTTVANVKKNKREIEAHAVRTPRSKPMPPPTAPQPTAAERKRLGEWLACGPN